MQKRTYTVPYPGAVFVMALLVLASCTSLAPEPLPPSTPTIPDTLPSTPEEPAPTEPVEAAQQCVLDEDCVVKNVGNCCGYYPRCVHVDDEPDLDAVRERCAQEGLSSVCGWADITHCVCDMGRCVSMQGDSVV